MSEVNDSSIRKITIHSLPPKGIRPGTTKGEEMAGEKIRVSWDEVQSVQVDAQIKQQEALAHAQQHYQQQPSPVQQFGLPTPRRTSIFYNALVYMTLFGAVGGVCAWAMGELCYGLVHSNLQELTHYVLEENTIWERLKRGEISEEAARHAIERLQDRFRDNPYVALTRDRNISNLEKDRLAKEMVEKDEKKEFWRQLIWFILLGTVLAFFLAVAEPTVSRNFSGVIVNGTVGAVLGLIGGFVVGLFINSLYRAMGGGQQASFAQLFFARVVGWGILGLFLTLGPGIVLRNIKRMLIGLGGGLIGGLIGGALFDLLGMWTNSDWVSRLVALIAIGAFAGLGTGIIENVAKAGWLRVVAGLIAGKQFILYRNPTAIGSSPQGEIYLFKDPQVRPRHALVHHVRGGFELEDQQSGTGTFVNGQPISRVRLRSGDQIQIGSTCFVFQEKARLPA